MKETKNYVEEYLPINGKQQYLLQFPCRNQQGPVVLCVHEPGRATSWQAEAMQQNLSEFCTVVHWDQLGAGKSLTANPDVFPTMEQLLKDMFVVVSCLKIKYWKQKIVILGYGFGSVLASLYVQKHPADVLCYIGAAQLVSLQENEAEAVSVLQQNLQGKDLQKLQALLPYPTRNLKEMMKKMPKVRRLQKGTGADRKQMLLSMVRSPRFSWHDLWAAYRGAKGSRSVYEFLLSHSMEMEQRPYKVPVHYVLGRNDRLISSGLAEKYLDRLQAPEKKLWVLADAGHDLMLSQPAAFRDTLIAILKTVEN